MSHRAVRVFADDGKLDVEELEELVKMAMRDGVFDDEEKHVIRTVLDQLSFDDLSKELILKIEELEQKYNF
ncbi:MAG: hypothetical protein V2I33_10405 [Kangiellaceae bacterium]|nr:hypothetical protein [Kangiellaceae bacterium]